MFVFHVLFIYSCFSAFSESAEFIFVCIGIVHQSFVNKHTCDVFKLQVQSGSQVSFL